MVKRIILLLTSTILLMSCSGLLWNGTPDYNGEKITISIDNPFYQGGDAAQQSSKALALQGQYLYIELARIEDQTLYNADTDKAVSGNGTWVETAWGGHAILTFDLNSWTEILEATFQGVPRDQALKARALLDTSESVLVAGIEGDYGVGNPICMTLDSSAPDIFEPVGTADRLDTMWVTVPQVSLAEGVLSLPVRPETLETVFWGSAYISDDYTSAAQTIPSLEATRFFLIDPDLASLQLRDVAYFSSVYGTVATDNAPPTSISLLYDNEGTPIGSSAITYTGSGPYYCRYLQMNSESLSDYTNPGYFFGTTLLLSPTLSWNVYFGIIYTSASLSIGVVSWTLPPGIYDTDLDFRVIESVSVSLSLADLETVDQINAIAMETDSGWISGTGNSYDSSGSIGSNTGQYFIVLAKPAGAPDEEAFILARNANGV